MWSSRRPAGSTTFSAKGGIVEFDDAGDPLFELAHLHYMPLIPSIGLVWTF
jgi:hypothetical protein